MTLKQLYYFLKITETGNLTKASKILHMSQPPLSYQLRMLEEELGVTLFVRDARNMQITPEGLYLKDMAIQILGLVDKTIEGMKNISAETSTTINIGMSANSNYNLLPNVIKAFQKKYPKFQTVIFITWVLILWQVKKRAELQPLVPICTAVRHF